MRYQGALGASLAMMIMSAWAFFHIYAVFFTHGWGVMRVLLLVALLTWLNVGLFIVAHDAMHRSLVPQHPRINLWFGRIALALYAAFSFDRLKALHLDHHRFSGSHEDPDFNMNHPRNFWLWYGEFMRRYFGAKEFLILCVPVSVYLLLGARVENILCFWAAPAALSSMQLFYFGTFLPHRVGDEAFPDAHNARTTQFNWLFSFMTCFHFGYHHEHHLSPYLPWWALPSERKRQAAARLDLQRAGPRCTSEYPG